jgi:hypothetical protein
MKKILLVIALLSLALPVSAQALVPAPDKHPYFHKVGHAMAAPFVWVHSKFSHKPATK